MPDRSRRKEPLIPNLVSKHLMIRAKRAPARTCNAARLTAIHDWLGWSPLLRHRAQHSQPSIGTRLSLLISRGCAGAPGTEVALPHHPNLWCTAYTMGGLAVFEDPCCSISCIDEFQRNILGESSTQFRTKKHLLGQPYEIATRSTFNSTCLSAPADHSPNPAISVAPRPSRVHCRCQAGFSGAHLDRKAEARECVTYSRYIRSIAVDCTVLYHHMRAVLSSFVISYLKLL